MFVNDRYFNSTENHSWLIVVSEYEKLDWKFPSELLSVHNSWLIVMDSGVSTFDLKRRFSQFILGNKVNLRYDSQVYSLGHGDDHALVLLEAYRIGPDSPSTVIKEVHYRLIKVLL